jgi:hypothetical protein
MDCVFNMNLTCFMMTKSTFGKNFFKNLQSCKNAKSLSKELKYICNRKFDRQNPKSLFLGKYFVVEVCNFWFHHLLQSAEIPMSKDIPRSTYLSHIFCFGMTGLSFLL